MYIQSSVIQYDHFLKGVRIGGGMNIWILRCYLYVIVYLLACPYEAVGT